MRRLTAVLTLAGVLVAGPASVALAHECIVANRSENGAKQAANSENWSTISTDDIIVFITGDPTLVAALSKPYRQAVAEAGLPTTIAIFERFTLGGKGPDKDAPTPGYEERGHSSDGKA